MKTTTYHPSHSGVCRDCRRPAAFTSNGYGSLCLTHFQMWFRQYEPFMDEVEQAPYRRWWAKVSTDPLGRLRPAPAEEHVIMNLTDVLGPHQLRLW